MNETIETISESKSDEIIAAESNAENKRDLITYLKNLEKPPKDSAALAHLRRGLGRKPGAAMEMYPYVGRFLTHETKQSYESAVFIVAALFAFYPDAKNASGNLGASLRQLKDKSDSIEKRFVALLNAEADELPYHLRQMIGLLKSGEKPIPVNWEQLFKDIQHWNNDQRFVQRKWAEQFWGNFKSETEEKTQENQETENTSEGEKL